MTARKMEGHWYVDLRIEGKRIRKRSPVDTKRGAQQYEAVLRGRLLAGEPLDGSKTKEVWRFKEFVDEKWWPTYPDSVGNQSTTKREKEIHLRVHLKPALGKRQLDEIQGEVAARLFAALRKKGLAEKSIKNIRATLRKVLVSAKEWGYLCAVPELPKVKVPEPAWDFFNPEESDHLLAATRSEEERTLLLFALKTGARAGEQLALEWGDIDWVNRQVVFRRSSTRGEVGPTKAGKERRVPLCDSLYNALKQHRHLKGDLVFCNHDGTPYSLWQLHERLWATCRKAGLRKIRWHDLRHSFASQAVMECVPLRVVQAWLGHSTITMVMRYSHLAPGADRDFIKRLDGQKVGSIWAAGGHRNGNRPQ